MKNILLAFYLLSLSSFAQTFQSGFDNLDYSNPLNNGHGASFACNVNADLHNNESVVMQGYINMFKATLDKRYLDQFIIHAKRVQERRDDNILTTYNQKDSSIDNGKWGIKIETGATYLFPTLFSTNSHDFSVKYNIGLSVVYAFHSKWYLSVGLNYNSLSEKSHYSLSTDSIYYYNMNYELLSSTVEIGYRLNINERFYFALEGGVVYGILNKDKLEQKTFKKTENSIYQDNEDTKSTLQLSFGIGFNYNISRKFSLYIIPKFRKSITPLINIRYNRYSEPIEDRNYLSYLMINTGFIFFI